ncbi:MAG: hypothetical protein ACLU76_13945 [Ruminococcus bicirculans (ex Wegman et al. 2014)]
MLKKILDKVLNEQKINNDEAISLINVDLEELKKAANQIREHFCGNNLIYVQLLMEKAVNAKKIVVLWALSTTIQIFKHDLLSSDEIKNGFI